VPLHRAPILSAVIAASASAGIPRPRGPRWRVRQAQVQQDPLDDGAISDDGDEAHPAVTAWVHERIDAPHMAQQRRPIPAGQTSARQHQERHGHAICRPHNDDPSVKDEPLLDFAAGYVLRALDQFPRQGSRAPWRVYQNYALDRRALRNAPIDDGVMQFSKAPPERLKTAG